MLTDMGGSPHISRWLFTQEKKYIYIYIHPGKKPDELVRKGEER